MNLILFQQLRKRTFSSYVVLSILLSLCILHFAHATQQFSIHYDAQLTLDSQRATNTGLSQSAINTLMGVVGNNVSIADMVDTVYFSKDKYYIESLGTPTRLLSMFMSGLLKRTSSGKISAGTLNTLRYVDIRGSKPALTTLIDEKNKTVLFYEGQRLLKQAAWQPRLQDVLSLSYAFIGKIPTQAISVSLSDGKGIKNAIFDIHNESLALPSGKWFAIKLTRRIADKDDASVECWIRASDGLPLRIRIGMNQRYGATLDLKSTKLPENVVSY